MIRIEYEEEKKPIKAVYFGNISYGDLWSLVVVYPKSGGIGGVRLLEEGRELTSFSPDNFRNLRDACNAILGETKWID